MADTQQDTAAPNLEPVPVRRRGFNTMTPEQRTEAARKGGLAAHAKGVAHQFTTQSAKEAGRKGGLATAGRRLAKQEEAEQRRAETTTV